MQVEFILGRAGSGKTTYCYQQIADELKKESYQDLIILVPEQFNLQTQIDLSKRLYPGLLRVEVTSFNTLAREIFKEVGREDIPLIDDLERIMIIKKIVEDHKTELSFFKKNIYSNGFIESINRFITVLEQSAADDKVLEELITDKESTALFKSKLKDIQLIYKYFEAYISGRFVTAEKTFSILAESIHKSQRLAETTVWIDGFYGFTCAQFEIVRQIMKKADAVKITLPSDKLYSLNDRVSELHPFYESIKDYQRFMNLCQEENISYYARYLDIEEIDDCGVAKEIAYIEENYFKSYIPAFKEESKNVALCLYQNRNNEIEQTAKRIISLVRDEGYRYRDIAIMTGDIADYKCELQSIFKEYEIPYFLDMKKNIHTNSLAAVIEGVLEVMTANYSYKSMMTLLRTYMLDIAIEDIDLLENYILAYGIKGKKKWHQPWSFNEEDLMLEEKVNELRKRVLEPIENLEKLVKESKESGEVKIIDLTKGLYSFLESIHAYESLERNKQRQKEEHNRLLELENEQIWGEIIEIFERLAAILGEEKVTVAAYKRIISTSFSYLKMGIIPPTQDQVIVGSIDRTRLPKIKAQFMLGVNEGVIPKADNGIDLFSDMDKMTLTKLCKEKDSAKDRLCDKVVNQPIYASNFSVYTAFTRATHKLSVSAVLADENGKALRPSMVYYKIKKMFKDIQSETECQLMDNVHRPLPAFGYIGTLLREDMEGRIANEAWKDAVSWFFENKEWHDRLIGLSSYLCYTNQQHYLDEKTANLLYEKVLYTSVSRLETFRSCPCCYFIKYGIKAEERKIFIWDSAQIGTLFHSTLEQYPKELSLLKTTWTEAAEEQIRLAVKKSALFAIEKHNKSFKENGKFKYTASKLEKMANRAIHALTAHLKNGDFVPSDYEVNFAEGKTLPPIEILLEKDKKMIITGQIDRVDIYYKELEGNYIKILDYKTGQKSFNLLEVYYGLQLQLLLYLDAYLKFNKDYKPAGVFYFHINNPLIQYRTGMNEEDINACHLKQFKLSGLVLETLDIIKAMDKDNRGDTIPASLNKDGSLKKGSSAANEVQFELLETHVLETIKDLGRQILEGRVSARPFKLGDKHPCLYCLYRTICQFDESLPDNTYEKLENISKDTVWNKLCERREKAHGMDEASAGSN